MTLKTKLALGIGSALLVLGAQSAQADCSSLRSQVSRSALQTALNTAVNVNENTGGYAGVTQMWVTLVDTSGKVCEVAISGNSNSGKNAGNKGWLGSRVISAQKANTANAFSLDNYSISTANLYAAVQEGGSLYGLQHSNPVDPSVAYQGAASLFGTASDPLKNKRVGGVNVFGGGLALYINGDGEAKKKIGAIGVSGDTSCRDHAVAWQIRKALGKDHVPKGITTVNFTPDGKLTNDPVDLTAPRNLTGAVKGDEMILKTSTSDSSSYWNAWAQPVCPNSDLGVDSTNNGTVKIPDPS